MSPRPNSLFILVSLLWGFFAAAFASLWAFFRALAGRPVAPLRETRFLDAVNFVFHTGPRGYWKKPSGLRAGRALATFLHYLFFKDASFRRK